MTCFVYIIGSFKANKLTTYVGWTNNIDERLNMHNSSKGAKSTRGRQWELIYYGIFSESHLRKISLYFSY